MSWLINDLANKAEALLDKVDQKAASALNETGPVPSNVPRIGDLPSDARLPQQPVGTSFPPISPPSSHQLNRTFPGEKEVQHTRVSSVGTGPTSNPRVAVPRVASVPSLRQKKADDDQKLFEFLNSGPADAVSPTPRVSTASDQTSCPPTIVDISSNEAGRRVVSMPVAAAKTEVDGQATPPVADQDDKGLTMPANQHSPGSSKATKRISQLELENKLLKTEVASLNEDASNAVQKFKRAQQDLVALQQQHRSEQQQLSDYQSIAASLNAKEQDYQEALRAKDSQLAVLRIRIQEADAELSTKSNLLQKTQGDNARILKDHSASSGLQGVALDDLRAKLTETEQFLTSEKERSSKLQLELTQAQDRFQDEHQTSALALKALQIKLNEEKSRSRESSRLLRASSDTTESAQRELQEYRDKATRILQAKERLISSLQNGTGTGNGATPFATAELADVTQERDSLRDEVQQMRYRLEQLRTELRENDHRHQIEADEQLDQIRNLEASIDEQRAINTKLNQDLNASAQDGRYLQEDLHRFKMTQQKELSDRDAEIVTLKHQLAISSSTTSSQQELESRVHSLTDSLIQKQTLVEALSTEKNSLVLQLERLEQQYRSVQDSLSRQLNVSRSETTYHDDSEGTRSRSIASIMPLQIQNSDHVKSTVNGIDKFSIRIGRLLRQYPAARLFVILYMAGSANDVTEHNNVCSSTAMNNSNEIQKTWQPAGED